MTALAGILQARIAATGPITMAQYMAECLLHPEHGYYSTRDPFGVAGDFTTAPEISQMFGEMIGLCLAQSWLDQGAPAAFTLAEIGPGRGTLMADILRATKAVPGFHAAASLLLVEASPVLRDVQRKTLAAYEVQWADELSALPDQPLWLVANEFIDALPVRQFQRDAHGWREVQVALKGGELSLGLSAAAPIALLQHRLADTRPGDIIEVCPAAGPVAEQVGAVIRDHGGAALFIDYGGWHSVGDTVQALRAHKMEDILASPGEADLTAHVDFETLALAAPCAHSKLTGQGVFLERLGITARAQCLATKLSSPALESHIAAHRRLTHPDEMGSLFKTLALYPDAGPPPPGFE
jgi:NADH dehydrogenase [ubiquinone] 1 alpha subcomplex assembly factor 7